MTTRTRFKVQEPTRPASEFYTEWHGGRMLRSHSFIALADRVLSHALNNDLTTVGIIGREGSGKSTVAGVLAHLLHSRISSTDLNKHNLPEQAREVLGRGYCVARLGAQHIEHFTETLARLPPSNRILVFDDSSFSMDRSGAQDVRADFTTIRHTQFGDLRHILIFNYHYTHALDKYLRDNQFRIMTSMTAEEVGNWDRLVQNDQHRLRIREFLKANAILQQGKPLKLTTRSRAGNATCTYRYNNPFRLCLWTDANDMRFAVYPDWRPVLGNCLTCPPCDVKTYVPDGKPDKAAAGAGEPNTARITNRLLNPADIAAWLKGEFDPAAVDRVLKAQGIELGLWASSVHPDGLIDRLLRLCYHGGFTTKAQMCEYYRDVLAPDTRRLKAHRVRKEVALKFADKFGVVLPATIRRRPITGASAAIGPTDKPV